MAKRQKSGRRDKGVLIEYINSADRRVSPLYEFNVPCAWHFAEKQAAHFPHLFDYLYKVIRKSCKFYWCNAGGHITCTA